MFEEFKEFEDYYQRFEKASIARRLAATLLDFLIYYFIGIILALIFDKTTTNIFSYNLTGVSALIAFMSMFFLWPISEGLWGQTIGKRFFDIKVVSKKNESINLGQAFIRFFLGILDFFFLVGIIVAIASKDNQRIGDAAASTYVVKSSYEK